MTTSHKVFLVAGALFAGGFIVSSCKDSSGNGNGNPGQAGSTGAGGGNAGTTGSAGTTGNAGSGGSGGGSGGSPDFMAIAPCLNESDYVTTTSTINFPASPTD